MGEVASRAAANATSGAPARARNTMPTALFLPQFSTGVV
jgi:hypothetical protein